MIPKPAQPGACFDEGEATANLTRQPLLAIPFIPLLTTLWALTHHYEGISRDGELYAVQALARLQPQLGGDLYLQNTTQDRYTFFSPLYASLIDIMGLHNAELLLFTVCSVGFLAAAWALARELSTGNAAWLAVALLILATGVYGAYQIFSYSENYLTARSLAEALVVAALAAHYCGRARLALGIVSLALLMHPLMALPGLILLIFVRPPTGGAAAVAATGILAALIVALTAAMWPAAGRQLIMDPAWLEVVRERSQFLFLEYWSTTDWELAARPFVCLTLAALVTRQERIRRLCLAAMLVGASGLIVAYIAGRVGPVAILLQGQAWRWMWITGFTSVLLLAPTALLIWRDDRCGPLCAMLLVLGWTYSGVDGLACTEGALVLWLMRSMISPRAAGYLRWAAAALGLILIVWLIANSWTISGSVIPESGREPLVIGRLREVLGMGISAVLLVVLCWHWLRSHRTRLTYAVAAAAFVASSAVTLPGALKQLSPVAAHAEFQEFREWREHIPATSTVLIVPTTKSAAFAWFTLRRPSYLSVDQSAGVVFSRATALEVRRRAEVLLPIGEPDYQILAQIERNRANPDKKPAEPPPLTAAALSSICRDPQLGFVIAREKLGIDALPHRHAGNWKDWNLYDCQRVRAGTPDS